MEKPVRIVPLYPTLRVSRAPIQAPAKLTYRGGPLLANVDVFTLFWGIAWIEAAQMNLQAWLNTFFDFILTSPLIDQLKEYSTPAYSIAYGKRSGTLMLTSPALGKTLTDTAIQSRLLDAIHSEIIPAPNPNRLYFLFLPPGVTVELDADRSCQVFCGYHNHIQGSIFYAVMPYPDCPACMGNMSPLNALTSTSSHELAEAITDPIPGQGWYDDQQGEIGDICAWDTKEMGTYTIQKEWSNQKNTCV